jgi:hypothetical protein
MTALAQARRLALILPVALAVAAVAAGTAAPAAQLTTVAPGSSPLSGRVVVDGSGFGVPRGTVRIGGADAIVSFWRDTEVVAYVPETSPLGTQPLALTTAAGETVTASIDVTARTSPGPPALWRFELDAPYSLHRPAVGPDGTVYVSDVYGALYALSPDGGLKWERQGPFGGEGAPSVGADGTVYVAGGPLIQAYAPDGTLRWSWEAADSQGILAGPTVGPDGNIYAAFDLPSSRMVSLRPDGTLRWSNPGNPAGMYEQGQIGREVVFGSGNAYIWEEASPARGSSASARPTATRRSPCTSAATKDSSPPARRATSTGTAPASRPSTPSPARAPRSGRPRASRRRPTSERTAPSTRPRSTAARESRRSPQTAGPAGRSCSRATRAGSCRPL